MLANVSCQLANIITCAVPTEKVDLPLNIVKPVQPVDNASTTNVTHSPTRAVIAQVPSLPSKLPTGNKNLPGAVLAYQSLVEQYSWPVNMALAIMACESGGNPNAVSRTNDHGLFQIHNGLVSYGGQIYDPASNIRIAYENYYKTRGWQPWSTYKNGCYRQYLDWCSLDDRPTCEELQKDDQRDHQSHNNDHRCKRWD